MAARAGRTGESPLRQGADAGPADAGGGFDDTLVGIIARAGECHRAGDLDGAAALYARALERAPENVHALHYLGLIAHQRGDHERALDLIGRAARLAPDHASVFSNLGAVHLALKNLRDAEASFRRAVELKPDLAEAHSNLAATLNDLGQREDAIAAYREAQRRAPDNAKFVKRLGDLYLEHEQFEDAAEWFGRFLALAQDNGEVHNNLGYALERIDRPDEAEVHYRRAAELCPQSPEINNNLASLLVRRGHSEEAEPYFQRALSIEPEKWKDLSQLAATYVNRRDPERAIPIYLRLVVARPDDAKLHNDYAIALALGDRLSESEAMFARAIELDPDYADAWNNRGSTLMRQGRRPEAIEAFKKAIAVQPRYLEPHINVCLALAYESRIDEAYLYAQATVHLDTYNPTKFSNPHKVFRAVCDFDAIDALGDMWEANDNIKSADFSSNFLEMLVFAETEEQITRLSEMHRRWYRDVVRRSVQNPLPPFDLRSRTGKLRLGIISSDLRRHSVAKFVLPVLENYDRDRFDIYCYSPSEDPSDAVQGHIKTLVKEFRVIRDATDREFAEIVRADAVDILFELNGFTRETRIKVLGYKPAPVQVYWLGYPFTTGIEEVDYFLLDPYAKPENDSWMVEKPLLMPECLVCFGSFEPEPISAKPPVDRNGVITFGSLNNPYKLTRAVVAAWARVMQQVPGSRFLYVRPECRSMMLVANLTREFERHGISRDRLFFVNNRATGLSHLSYYDEIDITLDTFPLTGGTTTCDTLWMGTPVVTKYGPSTHQRLSYSLLTNVGLQELCVRTDDEFVEKAVALAQDVDSLRLLRRELRRSVSESALGRSADFARAFCDRMSELSVRHGLR